MSVATILAAAMKQVAWDKIADLAIRHAPEALARVKAAYRSKTGGESRITIDRLQERIAELELTVLQQNDTILQLNSKIDALAEQCKTIHARSIIGLYLAGVALLVACGMLLREALR